MHEPPPPPTPFAFRRPWPLAAVIAALLLLNFLLRLPTWQVADWGQFAFYDPGTVLKGDLLLAKGYVATLDFGYTHGLLSLLYGHLGFAFLGRTPSAFLLLTLATEAVMAWALARFFRATLSARWPVLLFLLALPMAIMPAYLTLTHPLEAMLILLALAAHAEGKRPQALALLTACLFVKPSMAYLYGFVLTLLILWHTRSDKRQLLRAFLPALLTLVFLFTGLSLWMGIYPVLRTLLPTTGAATYAATGFGFFSVDGRQFWLPANPWQDFLTPAAVFLLAAAASAIAALWAIAYSPGFTRDRGNFASAGRSLPPIPGKPGAICERPIYELLLILGILHTTFLLAFYGWSGSWTYYAYLPLLSLTLLVSLLPKKLRIPSATILLALLLLSHAQLLGDITNGWHYKIRSAATADLFADPIQFQQFQEAVNAADHEPTLLLTNGDPPNLPPNITLPDAWFPEPGIPTASEISRVHAQALRSSCIILWWEYRRFDLWNSPAFADLRPRFHPIFHNQEFTVLHQLP